MFSIWSTVVMTCRRKATSEFPRLFLARRMKRVLGKNPKPRSRVSATLAWKLALKFGLKEANGELVVMRLLLNPTARFVPHWKPCKYEKFAVPVFWAVEAAAKELLERILLWSICRVLLRMGSKLVMGAPRPSVEFTKPFVPVPTPADP